MTTPSIPTAHERRAALQAKATAMGVDEDYISHLVDQFYMQIREHPLIGPVFNNAIGDNWDYHLIQMKSFWNSVALNTGQYSGKPMPKHVKLVNGDPAAQPWHFDIWLALFQKTLEDTAPSPDVVPYFMERAERIAQNLKIAMFNPSAWGREK